MASRMEQASRFQERKGKRCHPTTILRDIMAGRVPSRFKTRDLKRIPETSLRHYRVGNAFLSYGEGEYELILDHRYDIEDVSREDEEFDVTRCLPLHSGVLLRASAWPRNSRPAPSRR